METIQQTLVINDEHKAHIDLVLPENFPVGEAEVCIIIVPKSPQVSGKNALLLKLSGSLKNSKNFSGDPIEFQNKLRDEWNK